MTNSTQDATGVDWNHELLEQLDWHWRNQLRARLKGLTDDEYLWEPVAGCWNVRPRGQSTAPVQGGSGDFTIDFAMPEPVPAPVTTIAWRLAHVIVGVLGARAHNHFGHRSVGYMDFDYAGTADGALAQLDEMYTAWTEGVRSLGQEGFARPCGEAEGPYANYSMAALVLHVHREVIHHGAEIALLRDLYAHRIH